MDRATDLLKPLEYVATREQHWHWYLAPELGLKSVLPVADYLEQRAGAVAPSHYYKRSRRREVFDIESPEGMLFVKNYHLRKLKEQIRATGRYTGLAFGYRGAMSECANTLKARQQCNNVPQVLAFAERRQGPVVVQQVIVFEHLAQHTPLPVMLRALAEQPAAVEAVLQRVFDLIEQLYSRRLAHLDFHIENIMMANQPQGMDYIVDIEHFVPMAEPRLDVLGFFFGYLFNYYVKRFISEQRYDQLAHARMEQLLERQGISKQLCQYYTYFKHYELHRKTRMRMAQGGLNWVNRLRLQTRLKHISAV